MGGTVTGMPKLYRGQKRWSPGDEILAPTLRKNFANQDPNEATNSKLSEIAGALAEAETDKEDKRVRAWLEASLLGFQDTSTLSPYVSCSSAKSVAISFALEGDTPGYVIEIDNYDSYDVLDFNHIREHHNLWSDQKSWLKEVGIPHSVGPTLIRRVSEVRYDEHGRVMEVVIYDARATDKTA